MQSQFWKKREELENILPGMVFIRAQTWHNCRIVMDTLLLGEKSSVRGGI